MIQAAWILFISYSFFTLTSSATSFIEPNKVVICLKGTLNPPRITKSENYFEIYENERIHLKADLDESGVLRFSVNTQYEDGTRGMLRGAEAFDQMMKHFEGRVKYIQDDWLYGDNLELVNKLTAEGIPLREAILKTWTARQAARYGFHDARLQARSGAPGKYTAITVLFKPLSQ